MARAAVRSLPPRANTNTGRFGARLCSVARDARAAMAASGGLNSMMNITATYARSRSTDMASKPARVTVSASIFGMARRTSAASRNRSSNSSCTTRQRTVPRRRSTGIGASISVRFVWVVIALFRLFGNDKREANHGAYGDRLAVLQYRPVAQSAHRLDRCRVEYLGGLRVEYVHVRDRTIGADRVANLDPARRIVLHCLFWILRFELADPRQGFLRHLRQAAGQRCPLAEFFVERVHAGRGAHVGGQLRQPFGFLYLPGAKSGIGAVENLRLHRARQLCNGAVIRIRRAQQIQVVERAVIVGFGQFSLSEPRLRQLKVLRRISFLLRRLGASGAQLALQAGDAGRRRARLMHTGKHALNIAKMPLLHAAVCKLHQPLEH